MNRYIVHIYIDGTVYMISISATDRDNASKGVMSQMKAERRGHFYQIISVYRITDEQE